MTDAPGCDAETFPGDEAFFVVSADGVRRVRPRVTAQQRAVSLPWCPILEGEAQTGQRSARLRHHQQTPVAASSLCAGLGLANAPSTPVVGVRK